MTSRPPRLPRSVGRVEGSPPPAPTCAHLRPIPMAFLFLSYLATFACVIRGRRSAALAGLALSTALSVAMFFHHTTSGLELNF
jgi:hypothetical protein